MIQLAPDPKQTLPQTTLAVSLASPVYKVRIQFWNKRKQAVMRQLPKPCRLYHEIQMLQISKQKLYFNPQLHSKWTFSLEAYWPEGLWSHSGFYPSNPLPTVRLQNRKLKPSPYNLILSLAIFQVL